MKDSKSKTIVYIDSFNLYYGILNQNNKKGLKWLNLETWLDKLLTKNDIIEIKFFTARVSGKQDKEKPIRQNLYFRALNTLKRFKIIEGHFLIKNVKLHINSDVTIIGRVNEEKGTDVNLAVHLLNDAHNKRFDTAVIVSNDSDLAEVVKIVTQELKLKVGVLNPCKITSRKLNEFASFTESIREGPIEDSQFLQKLEDANGDILKPATW